MKSGIISTISEVFVTCETAVTRSIALIEARPTNDSDKRPASANRLIRYRSAKVASKTISGAIILDSFGVLLLFNSPMKIKLLLIAAFVSTSCSSPSATNNAGAPQAGTALKSSPSPVVSPTPVPTSITPKNGDYNAKGVVTKINLEQASVELNHEDIPGLMPPMIMEFFVTEKKLLDGLKVGDKVDFVIRYKDHTEKIVDIKKAK